MPSTGWTPSIVPHGDDQTVYLVVDRFDGLGAAYRETDVVRTDLETTITDLMSGQFSDPVRVVQSRYDIDGHDVPEALEDFVDSYAGPDRQLMLRLARS
jgi:hypothetical protein